MNARDLAFDVWLEHLASRTPTPGGGAVAAVCGALAAALVGMVTKYTTGPKWADREDRMLDLDAEASDLRVRALALVDDDIAAFDAVSAAYKLPKDSVEERSARTASIQRALVKAAVPPAHVGRLALRILEIAEELTEAANPNVASDVAVAASAARAAIEGAIVNIEINRQQIVEAAELATLDRVLSELGEGVALADRIVASVRATMS